MKVLLVNGSPNIHGCTDTALQEVSKTLNEAGIETEIFWIGNRAMQGCIGCDRCASEHRCIFDDKVNEFIDKAKDADGFVFGSPVYYGSANGSLIAFMDRVFYAADSDIFYLKPAASIASARRAGTTFTCDELDRFFSLMQMPIITSRYWNIIFGNTPEEVRKDLEGMQVMRTLGRNMAYFIRSLKQADLPKPEREKTAYTNFIR